MSMALLMGLCGAVPAAGAGLDRQARQWVPVEWTLKNPGHRGNPFDLIATATFVHEAGGRKITTGMFHAGGDTWKFRFTATRPGKWTFVTAGKAPALAGKRGTVTVAANPRARGFVTGFGSKWGWSGTGEVFVPQLVMYFTPDKFHRKPQRVDRDIRTFLVGHGFNGFHVMVFCRWFDIAQDSVSRLRTKDPNPDPRTFEALEMLIRKTHAAGGMVHLWMWGDESRRQTPIRLGGKNGPVDLRLQRYIAARLGPIPGWTLGYGFDLDEWTTEKDLRGWHAHMHKHLGWRHLLGGRSVGPNQYRPGIKFPQIYEGLDYWGYEQHRPTYEAYVAAIAARPNKPTFSEDRFRIRTRGYPGKDYDLERTRRGLWHSTMAGGVANIWGNLGSSSRDGSLPYPKPHYIKTWSVFFRGRFLKDMRPDNRLTDGVCLARPTRTQTVFYKEDAESIRLDLAAMVDPRLPAGAAVVAPPSAQTAAPLGRAGLPAVAVDTRKPYKEIDIGPLQPKRQTWKAPYRSDWAIAVGRFGGR